MSLSEMQMPGLSFCPLGDKPAVSQAIVLQLHRTILYGRVGTWCVVLVGALLGGLGCALG
jgi:hypothetical protein